MGGGSLYDIKYWLMWYGKVLAQVIESTLLCERTWVQVLSMSIVCYLIIIVFNIMIDHVEW